ncbi:class I SAM-dependent methyltransferase [Massilia oculi]|uniref:Class I SAM-dependent methyltransferase n=1 Tax=Massilia hydrophila TaxID=3044279 RepID=A0ABS7Y950_9BURK|nr:class I SAM-dependent methyltransferase [Massilia oculi]MCA1856211.1 class I SAM-dependent methyltransferase [Massilia oculi]
MKHFSDPGAVAHYHQGPPRLVPGFHDLQRMAQVLLAERAPPDARVLVLGAGGGLELKAFADAQPGWRFDGVDPSPDMLALAQDTVGEHAHRVSLHAGYVDVAPPGPFDAAACLLTMHFMPLCERRHAVRAIRRRLRRGAPFVAAHMSFAQDGLERERCLARDEAYALAAGAPPDEARRRRALIARVLPVLAPEQDEALLREEGFRDVGMFYAAGVFRGWVAYA